MVNVIVCGTPGTGKSTLINKLKTDKSLKKLSFINLSEFALENGCTSAFDDNLESHVIDEDKLNRFLRPKLEVSGRVNLIECIHADMIDPDLIDLVFVCRTNNTQLYDRLKARNYNEAKIGNNIQAEIFQTILDEVKEVFSGESMCVELTNDSLDDLDRNVELVKDKMCELIELSEKE